ncbi:hypothetical protein BD626DRAFT_511823, partial [Schizophyllum amplum]
HLHVPPPTTHDRPYLSTAGLCAIALISAFLLYHRRASPSIWSKSHLPPIWRGILHRSGGILHRSGGILHRPGGILHRSEGEAASSTILFTDL